jgi:ribonuclease E
VPLEDVTVAPIAAAGAVAEINLVPASASLVTPDAATADATSDEHRGKRRRRRRGRGGRGGEGEATSGVAVSERDVDEDLAEAAHMVPESVEEAIMPSTAIAVPAGNGSAIARPETTMTSVEDRSIASEPAERERPREAAAVAHHEVAAVTPQLIVVPTTFSLPVAAVAPMPVEHLESVLQLAGLTLVQTEPAKLEQTRARMATEPRTLRVPRERPVLPPQDSGPLVQVETRLTQGRTS